MVNHTKLLAATKYTVCRPNHTLKKGGIILIFCASYYTSSACGIQHLQRGGNRQLDLFESIYFTFVTLSTVGFGDIYPDIWPSQLFMLCVITAALLILPTQVRDLIFLGTEDNTNTDFACLYAKLLEKVLVSFQYFNFPSYPHPL